MVFDYVARLVGTDTVVENALLVDIVVEIALLVSAVETLEVVGSYGTLS